MELIDDCFMCDLSFSQNNKNNSLYGHIQIKNSLYRKFIPLYYPVCKKCVRKFSIMKIWHWIDLQMTLMFEDFTDVINLRQSMLNYLIKPTRKQKRMLKAEFLDFLTSQVLFYLPLESERLNPNSFLQGVTDQDITNIFYVNESECFLYCIAEQRRRQEKRIREERIDKFEHLALEWFHDLIGTEFEFLYGSLRTDVVRMFEEDLLRE